MSKDFRAKQVRTNKIIGRSDGAVGGSGTKIQLALMKSGSADFAGGLKSPANPTVGGDDVGRIDREKGNVGTDVWMLVDGASSNRYSRSSGESVLFLGDVVVSGTLYAERQRISITTTSLFANEDHSLLLSGSVFVNEDQGISVGKTALINGATPSLTDPRTSLSLGAKDSVFWAGNNAGTHVGSSSGVVDGGAGDTRKNADEANTPDPLLVILPDLNDDDADSNKRGRIGIGTHSPGAKLEIMAPTGPSGGDAEVPHLKFRNSTNSDDDNATFTLLDNGSLKIATNDATAQSGDLVFDVDGATDLNSYGNITIDSSNGTISVGADAVAQAINIGTGGAARTITIGNETGATSIDIDAGTGGVAIDSQGAGSIGIGTQTDTGAINIGTGASARTITMGNVTGATGLVLNAGTNGVAINSTGAGDIVINSDDVMTLDSDGVLEINSSAGAISIGNDDVSQAINVGTGAAARTITIGNATGATEIDVNTGTGGFKVDTQSGGSISLDAVAAASNLTVSTGGADAKDLTLSVTGGGNSSLFITSDGTGADSLEIDTTVGSMTIAKSLADGQTLKVGKNGAVEMIFSPHGTASSEKWSLINTSGNAVDAVKIQAVAGGLDIDAGTVLNIDSASSLTATSATGDVNIVAEANNAKVRLRGDNESDVAIHLDGNAAAASIVDIDAGILDIDADGLVTIDSSAGAIEMTASGAAGHINVVTGHTAGVAFHLDANANAASEVQIDAGILDIDVTGATTIDGVGIALGAGSGELDLTTTGLLDVNANSLDMDLTDSSTITITSSEASEDLTIEQVGANDSSIIVQAAGTGTDAIKLNASGGGIDVDAGTGGIAIDTTGTLSLDSADTTNLTMIANAGSVKSLTINAVNQGSSTATIEIGTISGATPVNIGHSTNLTTVKGNLTVDGDLTVSGATTTLDVANLLVEDPFILLAKNQTGSPGLDAGFLVERGDLDNVAFIWDETNGDVFRAITTNSAANTAGNVATSGHVPVAASQFYLESSSNKIDLDTDVVITAAADITLAVGGANVKPNADNTIALGVAGTAFSDLFLGSGAVVNFNAGDTTLTHVNTVGLLLNGSKQLQFGDSGTYIHQSADSKLDLAADGEINLTTGKVTITQGVSDQGTAPTLTLRTTDAGTNDGSVLRFEKDPADAGSIAQFENLGEIYWYGAKGDGSAFYPGAAIIAEAETNWADGTSHNTMLKIGTTSGNGNPGEDLTIRSDGKVGIGTVDPDFHLHVVSNNPQLKLAYDSDSFATVTVASDSDTTLATAQNGDFTIDAGGNVILDAGGGGSSPKFKFLGAGSQFLQITKSGDDAHFRNTAGTLIFSLDNSENSILVNDTIPIQFRDSALSISSPSDALLRLNSDGDIDLTATNDINIPASVGLTFGADTNKVEVDGSNDMTVITANDMTFQTGGADADRFLFRNGGDTSEETTVCVGNTNTFIQRLAGSSNVNFQSDRPITVNSTSGAVNLYGSAINMKTQNGGAPVFNVSLDTDTILLANHANDIVFKTNPGSVAEIARFDTSESSLVMATSNKVQFREATTFIHSPGANTLDIETGTSNNGVINIGTDNSSNITIGKAGSGGTTTINNLSLTSVTITGDTGRMTFDGSGTDPFIERTAGSAMRFTDSSNTNVTLSDLASNAVSSAAFTTIEAPTAHRAVVNSARRLALIGSGSVGGTHADELYGFNATTAVSDIMLFCSGTIKPIGKNTPHGTGTGVDKFQRRNVALDSNLVASGSVSLRGLYHTDAQGDIANKSGQSSPHPVGAANASTGYTGYVFTVDQTNAANTGAANLHGTAFLHGNLRMTYSAAAIHCPVASGADLEIQNFAGSNTLIKFDPDNAGSDPHVMIPSDSSSKLAFGANTRYISNPNGTTDIKIETPGNVDIPTGKLVLGSDADGADRSIVFGHTTLKSRIGIDDSGDVFAINTDQNFESSNDLEIDASGNVTIGNGNLIIDGGEVHGPTDGQLKLYADTNVCINIDVDGSGTDALFKVQTNSQTTRFEVSETGNVQMDGNLRVDGNIIQNSQGETTITMDTAQNVTAAADLTATGALSGASLNLNEGNITNVGSIGCDSIAADAAGVGLDIQFTGNTSYNKISLTDNLNDALSITQSTNTYLQFVTSNSAEKIQIHKNFLPVGSVDLGSTSQRFANIYTNDLNLCNEGRGNDVDGTSGNWTIQEGEDNLYVINNITGKKFKMMLTPVEDGE